ncbi:MAG: hypothetical protein WDO24_08405 [Pseudomonadota bacterium]
MNDQRPPIELDFFQDPKFAGLLGAVVALSGELLVLKAEVKRLRSALETDGTIDLHRLEQAGESPEVRRWIAREAEDQAARRAGPAPDARRRARCSTSDADCRSGGHIMTNAVPHIPFEVRAYQDFVRGLRAVWRTDAYSRTLDEAHRISAGTVGERERMMAASTPYQLYAWLERRSQQYNISAAGAWCAVGYPAGRAGRRARGRGGGRTGPTAVGAGLRGAGLCPRRRHAPASRRDLEQRCRRLRL